MREDLRHQLLGQPRKGAFDVARDPQPEAKNEEAGLESFFADSEQEYQAHARPTPKPILAIHFIPNAIGEIRSCQYFHLDSYHCRFLPLIEQHDHNGNGIILRFNGSVTTEVTLVGINLYQLYDYLCQHRMPWVYEAEPVQAQAVQGTVITHLSWRVVHEGDHG